MLVLDWNRGKHPLGEGGVAVIFGVGLIGRSVQNALNRSVQPTTTKFESVWEQAEARSRHLEAIASHIVDLLQRDHRKTRVDIVWSAGRAGFATSKAECSLETEAFKSVTALAARLMELQQRPQIRFHLLSSAGGLFEGQRNVGSASEPRPLRPYGQAKLEQEKVLSELTEDAIKFVYRPSSVYGCSDRGGRAGLIVTLMHSAINNQTTRIFGGHETLRDYVFADDIGKFICRQILRGESRSQTFLLASGRPASMMEAIRLVERAMNRKLLLQFQPDESNTSSNSFRPIALPHGWFPTQLEIGIAVTAMRIRSDFVKGSSSSLN
jgi:UDP-glucose 4-epimerase